MLCACFLVIVSLSGCFMHPLSQHEPKCHSRFDYDEKLLSKMIRMEMTMETVLSRMEQNEKATGLAIAEMEQSALDISNNFKTQKEAAESALVAATDKSKAATDLAIADLRQTMLLDMDNAAKALKDATEKSLTAAVEKAELAVAEMQKRYESSLKSNVMFHVKDVSPQPTTGNIIKFTTVVKNVGGGYSKTSGCFTAPVQGAYWFSSQICTHTNNYISPSIFIRGTLASRVFVRDKDDGVCGSVTAVSVLEVGDEVCLKSGPYQYTNTSPVWSDDSYNSNNFMGALIN